MHVQQKTAANGVSARKVVVMGLWRGFALVYQRKGKVAKYGKTIVKVLILLIEIYLSLQSDFGFNDLYNFTFISIKLQIQITNTKVILTVHVMENL